MLGEWLVRNLILGAQLVLDQLVHAVKGHAAVVADNAAAAVGIGETGDDVGGTRGANARSVNIEDRIIVGLAVLREDVLDPLLRLQARLADGRLHHTPAAVGHHGALERGISL